MKLYRSIAIAALLLPTVLAAADFDPAAAVNGLGLDVFQRLEGANLVVSPYSIETALALAYAGSDGTTRAEMAAVLRLPLEEAKVQPGFAALRSGLEHMAADSNAENGHRNRGRMVPEPRNARSGDSPEEPVNGIEWHAANRLFAERDYAFRDSFLNLMRDGYGAPLEQSDFRHDPEQARSVINHWVEEQTQNKIRNLIPAGGVTKASRLVLVNALYLKAPWDQPFRHKATSPEPFHLANRTVRDVPMMRQTGRFRYGHEAGFTLVGLDYLGGELQCLILLPDEGETLAVAAHRITVETLARWARSDVLPAERVDLHLPKFRVKGASLALGPVLRELGMKSAFDEPHGSANFDRIAPRQPDDYLAISDVYHQTFVALDEAGTEAAAATAVSMVTALAVRPQAPPIEVRVDRPFLFVIQHHESGVALFVGRIADPAE